MVSMYEKEKQEQITCYVDIGKMEYGLSRVLVKDTTDSYYYVPVLVLRGNVEYRGEDTGTVYYSYVDYGVGLETLLWISAVDGSIIGN